MTAALASPRPSRWRRLARVNVAVLVFGAIYALVALRQPSYLEPGGLFNFLRRAAPLAIVACGELFVIVAGGFDLSVGALVTLAVLGPSMLIGGDPAQTWWAIGVIYAVGLVVGAANGAIVGWLKVPSIIATLGMMLVLRGVSLLWSGGSPRGYLPDNFRMFGRLVLHDVPVTGTLPLAVIVLVVVVALAAWLLHGTVFGKRLFAAGDNAVAAELGGVAIRPTRLAAFVLSALGAVTGGILLGGFAGVSLDVGDGMEMGAISACVIGGAQLLGGRGSVTGAVAGSLSLYALFTLLNLVGLPPAVRDTAQGLILISAVAIGARRRRRD
jgi:ribose transport system permease protein